MKIEEVKEKIYFKGFERDLYADLDQQIAEGISEITLNKSLKIDEQEVNYKLHIKNDVENGQLYFNNFDISFKMAGGDLREHTFSTNRMITAMEGYRMAKLGDKVAVFKTLYKDDTPYNTWLSLAIDKPKDEFGNYTYNSFHENYYKKEPFNLKVELGKLEIPVKELENPENLDRFEKSLQKANLIPVTMVVDGKEIKGFIGVNPEKGRVVLYNDQLELFVHARQEQSSTINNEVSPQNEEVKKKPWERQKVDWKPKNQNRGRGI